MRETSRIIGVDIAKIVAMVFVVGTHVGGMGFPIEGGCCLPWVRGTSLGLFDACVDIFAIASGYVGFGVPFKLSRLVELWLQVVFTCVVCSLGLVWTTGQSPGLQEWVRAFMPIAGGKYWYMTAYFMLAFTMPFLNAGLRSLDRKTSLRILSLMVGIVCGQASLGIKGGLGVEAGASFEWLLICYLLGAYWRLHGFPLNVSRRQWLLPILPLAVISGCGVLALPESLAGRVYWRGSISPLSLALSICIFGWALTVASPGEVWGKVIRRLSSCTLGVYLFHLAPVVWGNGVLPRIRTWVVHDSLTWIVCVAGTTALLFVGCAFVDAVRQVIFKAVKRYVSK